MKAPHAKTSACALCGRPARAAATAATGGAKLAFCCRGCAEVYTLFARRGWSAALEAAPAAPPPPEAKLENARYLVRGLWCPSCAWGLERYLRRCPGVVSARVDYLDARCELQIAAGAGDARRWIAALGFEAVAEGAAWDASGGLALRAGLALFIGMGVMTLSWSGYAPALLSGGSAAAGGPFVDLAAGAGAALIVFGCGWPILRGGWLGLRRGAATMDTLIAASGLAAFGLSAFEWAQARVAYFDVPAMLFAFLLAGRWLEQRARLRAQRDLARWQPPPALAWRVARGLSCEPVAASALAAGDCILLRPADRVPADCRLVAGAVMADESLLTGEARPLRREAGATLFAGALITAIVGPEPARAEVLRPAADSRLAEIAAQVERTRRARSGSRQSRRLDRWAAYFVPIVAGLALLTLALNYRFGAGAAAAWLRAISVLILACPCTLGLALPLVEERAVALAARRGILIQDLDALPALLACDMVVLDKTGTVTAGAAAVTTFACAAAGNRVAAAAGAAGGAGDATVARSEESGEQALLGAAAALEADTLHPLGEAIRDFSARRLAAGGGDGSARWASIETVAGQGVRGRAAEGSEWRIGRAEFAAPRGLPPELARLAASARAAGDRVAILGREGEALALFALRDRVRAGARAAIRGW
ncbi:MAG: heavy metal translocating P-type ATPase, partial [Terriglobales bacterium]